MDTMRQVPLEVFYYVFHMNMQPLFVWKDRAHQELALFIPFIKKCLCTGLLHQMSWSSGTEPNSLVHLISCVLKSVCSCGSFTVESTMNLQEKYVKVQTYINKFKELELNVTPSKSLSPYFQKLWHLWKEYTIHRTSTVSGYFLECYHVIGPFLSSLWSINWNQLYIKDEIDKILKAIFCVPHL